MKRFLRSAVAVTFPLVERLSRSKAMLIQTSEVHTLPERMHLKRFIEHFRVDCIFDVGANMGQYATMLREKVGYRGLIVSFEPVPECVAHLRTLSAADPLWRIEPVALSDEAGEATFNVMAESQFSSLGVPDHSRIDLFTQYNAVSRSLPVHVGTVADYQEKYRAEFGFSRPFLKMDTQGNDVKVATGAGERLAEFVGLQSELSVIGIYEESVSYIDAIAFYESRGFRLSAFVPNNRGHFPNLVEMDCIMFNPAFLP